VNSKARTKSLAWPAPCRQSISYGFARELHELLGVLEFSILLAKALELEAECAKAAADLPAERRDGAVRSTSEYRVVLRAFGGFDPTRKKWHCLTSRKAYMHSEQ
jgi:hypothetical protein